MTFLSILSLILINFLAKRKTLLLVFFFFLLCVNLAATCSAPNCCSNKCVCKTWKGSNRFRIHSDNNLLDTLEMTSLLVGIKISKLPERSHCRGMFINTAVEMMLLLESYTCFIKSTFSERKITLSCSFCCNRKNNLSSF